MGKTDRRTRSILILPRFANRSVIDRLRSLYDPLAERVPPHLTLVFPFTSDLTTAEVLTHVQEAVRSVQPFRLTLGGIVGAGGEYLFLQVREGQEQMIELHDRLYTGLFAHYLRRDLPYVPHLTVGRLEEAVAYQKALQDTKELADVFSTTIDSIDIEIIGPDEESIIESTVRL